MTELELYKYINDNNIEWHRHDNNGNPDVIILPYIFELEEFANLITSYTDDEGMDCRLKGKYIGIWMQDICQYYEIDMDKVFIEN